MNKYLKFFGVLIFMIVFCFSITGCKKKKDDNKHEHLYDKMISTEAYFSSSANCDHGELYYYSCECGEKGSSTYEVGEQQHIFLNGIYNGDETLIDCGTISYKCTNCEYVEIEEILGEGGTPFLEYTDLNSTTCMIDGISESYVNKIIIPEYYNEKEVVSIKKSVFSYCDNLKSVYIPKTVTSLSSGIFGEFGQELKNKGNIVVYTEHESKPNGWNDQWKFSIVFVYWGINKNNFVEIDDAQYVLDLEQNTATMTRYLGEGINVVIPETIEHNDTSFTVTSIGSCAFKNNISMKSLSIPDSIIEVGENAFYGCTSLEYNIYDNVKYLGNNENPYVALIEFNSDSYNNDLSYTVNPNTKVICYGAFDDCSDLYNLTIGSSVQNIEIAAFSDCNNLVNVYYTGTIEDWCNISFCDSESNPMSYAEHFYMLDNNEYYEVTEIVIPDTITEIGQYQFYGFNYVTSIIISNSVVSINKCGLALCGIRNIAIPNNVITLEKSAFALCKNLEYVFIPETVINIDAHLFAEGQYITVYCEPESKPTGWNELWDELVSFVYWGVSEADFCEINDIHYLLDSDNQSAMITKYNGTATSLVIPSEIEYNNIVYEVIYIEDYAFEKNKYLTSIEIPDSIIYMGFGAFYQCENLENMTIPFVGATKDDVEYTNFGYIFGAPKYIYNRAYVSPNLKKVIVSGGNKIDTCAFYQCDMLENIIIAENITTIGYSAFESCTKLKEIIIPEGIISIESYAFYNCENLSKISIPNSIVKIGSYAFHGCNKLELLYEEGSTYVGNEDNPYLVLLSVTNKNTTNIIINPNTKVIGGNAFEKLHNLKTFEIPNNIISIGDFAFSNCTSLESIIIPDSVISIGYYAFSECINLTSVTLPKNISRIEHRTFYKCSSLENIIIPENVVYIGEYAFAYCTKLTSIDLSNNLTTINEYVFAYCTQLTSINLSNNLTTINAYAFVDCSSLETIFLSASVQVIGEYVFSGCSKLTIYCENRVRPATFDSKWNPDYRPVVWGYTE